MKNKKREIFARMASPDDAEALARITAPTFKDLNIQWEGATNDWIVVELDGEIHGCVQLCLGKPVGRLELMCVTEDLDPRIKHGIMLELARSGMYALHQTGSQIITVFAAFDSRSFKRLIKKYFDARVTNSGNLLTTYLGT